MNVLCRGWVKMLTGNLLCEAEGPLSRVLCIHSKKLQVNSQVNSFNKRSNKRYQDQRRREKVSRWSPELETKITPWLEGEAKQKCIAYRPSTGRGCLGSPTAQMWITVGNEPQWGCHRSCFETEVPSTERGQGCPSASPGPRTKPWSHMCAHW